VVLDWRCVQFTHWIFIGAIVRDTWLRLWTDLIALLLCRIRCRNGLRWVKVLSLWLRGAIGLWWVASWLALRIALWRILSGLLGLLLLVLLLLLVMMFSCRRGPKSCSSCTSCTGAAMMLLAFSHTSLIEGSSSGLAIACSDCLVAATEEVKGDEPNDC
jgi:hypothetical protein